MKVLFCLCLMLVCVSIQARADGFDFTGYDAVNNGSILQPDYFSFYNPNIVTLVGGPNDDGGIAEQFLINSPVSISSITISAEVNSLYADALNSSTNTSLQYLIYSGSLTDSNLSNNPSPDLHDLVASSNVLNFPSISSSYDTSANIDVTLNPGDYWLVEQGTGPSIIRTSQTYVDPPLNTAVAPEPPSIYLLLAGLFFLFINSCKNRSGLNIIEHEANRFR